MPSTLKEKIKHWAGIVWHVPGVENAALQIVIKILVRVGLPSAAGAVVIGVAEAVGASL